MFVFSYLTAVIIGFHVLLTPIDAVRVSTYAGTGEYGHADGPKNKSTFATPYGVAVDRTGTVYVAEASRGSIRIITPDGLTSTIGFGSDDGWIGDHDGGPSSEWTAVDTVAVDGVSGGLFVASWTSNKIRRVAPNGDIRVFAGSDAAGFVDGAVGDARFRHPKGLAFDVHSGSLIVADSDNHVVRRISPDGVVSTLAGDGVRGWTDGHGAKARFNIPYDVDVDHLGNVYVADTINQLIRKITPDGNVSTIAGTGTVGFRDGPGSEAQFNFPNSIAVGSNGTLFVAESFGNRIRKISANGIVTTVAGDGTSGFADGPGRVSCFKNPTSIAIDSDGNLFVADSGNRRIRKLTFGRGGENTDGEDDDDVNAIASYGDAVPKPIHYGKDECAICYEVKGDADEYDFCSLRCGNTFHKKCIDRCMANATQKKCPMCRDRWIMGKPPVTIPNAL